MPTFEYIARDPAGQQKTGLMQADNEAAVVRTLAQQTLYPVRVAPHQGSGQPALRRRRRIRLRQLGHTYAQMADLLEAGVPLLRGLEIIVKTTGNTGLKDVLNEVHDDVSAGKTLGDALARHPGVFTELHVDMVRAGERADFLESVLRNLSGFLERQDELQGKVRRAMVYPAILIGVGSLLVTAILVFFVPRFQEFMSDMPLPLPTRLLFALSHALRRQGLLLLGALLAAGLLVRGWIQSDAGRTMWERLKIKVPLAGPAIRMVAVTRFCRVLGTLLTNGVPILQALHIAKNATGNLRMTQAIEQAAENVKAGAALAEPLSQSGLFPPEVIEMIAVAEESNQLEKVLLAMADGIERRTNRQVDLAVRLIEPLLLIVMAVMVGFIAVGLLFPVFTMASSFK